MSNRSPDSQMPAFLPSLILLGAFALVLMIVLPQRRVESPTPAAADVETVEATELAPITAVAAGAAFDVKSAFAWSCAGCHGATGEGNPPFGPGFLDNDLWNNDAALLAFLTDTRPPVDPALEFPHPPRGGYPALTDGQLAELIDYLHTLADESD